MKAQVNFDSLGSGGDIVGDILYENPTPLSPSSVAAFTLNVDGGVYSRLLIVCYDNRNDAAESDYLAALIEEDGLKGNPCFITYDGGSFCAYGRYFTWNNGVLSVESGYRFAMPSATRSYNDGWMLPYRIYGIR